MQTYWCQKWGDSRHLCRMPLSLLWPLLFLPYGLSYGFNVLISWICHWGFSSRPNVKIVLGTSICLLSCFVNRLLAWPHRQQKNIFSSLSLTFCIHGIIECGSGDFVWCLCIIRISFWCGLNTLMTVLPCLSPGCSCYRDGSEGRGIPFVCSTEPVRLMPPLCSQELLIRVFCCLLLQRWEGSSG